MFDLVWLTCSFWNAMHHLSWSCSASFRSPSEIPILDQRYSVHKCLLPAFPISYPRHSGDNLQSDQTILNQDVQGAVPSSCSLDDNEKSEMFNTRAIRTRVRQMWEADMEKENQQTWRVKNDAQQGMMMEAWFREGRCGRQLISKGGQWADGRHEQCAEKRSLLLKRVSGSVRGNNQRKSDMGRGRNRSRVQRCNIKTTVCNMTKVVIWRRSPWCRLFFVTVLCVKIDHTRGGRVWPIASRSPEAET